MSTPELVAAFYEQIWNSGNTEAAPAAIQVVLLMVGLLLDVGRLKGPAR